MYRKNFLNILNVSLNKNATYLMIINDLYTYVHINKYECI